MFRARSTEFLKTSESFQKGVYSVRLEIIGTNIWRCCRLEIDICRAIEISVFAGKFDVEMAAGPAVGDSSSKAEYWRFVREGGDRGVVGRLEDRGGVTAIGEEVGEREEMKGA